MLYDNRQTRLQVKILLCPAIAAAEARRSLRQCPRLHDYQDCVSILARFVCITTVAVDFLASLCSCQLEVAQMLWIQLLMASSRLEGMIDQVGDVCGSSAGILGIYHSCQFLKIEQTFTNNMDDLMVEHYFLGLEAADRTEPH
jgi:hypothetical protein